MRWRPCVRWVSVWRLHVDTVELPSEGGFVVDVELRLPLPWLRRTGTA
jgi:hypothetical protein